MIQVFSQRRIARSLVTILVLGFIQSVVAPLFIPEILSPKAHAATATFSAGQSGTWTVPDGVTSIDITLTGAKGGIGGDDGKGQGQPGYVGQVTGTLSVRPGMQIRYGVGNNGSNGSSGSATGGGAAGTNPIDASYNGGAGGDSLKYGSSGGGGGGGAASIIILNGSTIVAAGGGGGGGGNNCESPATPYSFGASADGNVLASTGKTGAKGRGYADDNNTSHDGSGAGGGGGGWVGGAGGKVILNTCTEYLGFSGYAGTNNLGAFSGLTGSGVANSNAPGFNISYTSSAYGNCNPTSSTSGVYTILTFTSIDQCTWTVPANVTTIDMFGVGGGGGGGADGGAGGGGGAAFSRTAFNVTAGGSITVHIGYGGREGNYAQNAGQFGDSTTVTSGTTTLVAGGGSGGLTSPQGSATKTAGGTSPIGFSGGAGGTPTTGSGQTGSNGDSGTANYLTGSSIQYGGGGGGGIYASSTRAGSIGLSGGGNGASNTNGTAPAGGNGTNGLGGGGGGGSAGTPITSGGKGGSGTLIIRYTTNASWQFPDNVASKLYARYLGSDLQTLDSTRSTWMDSSGNSSRSGTITRTGSIESVVAVSGFGSTSTLYAASGNQTSKIRFADLPSTASGGYTLFHVARYSGANQGRIFDATGSNWLSGFLDAHVGVAHHETGYLTQYAADAAVSTGHYNWLLSTDQVNRYRANGILQNASSWTAQTVSTGFGINQNGYSQFSNWQVVDVLVFQGELNLYEIRQIEKYLTTIYGLGISTTVNPIDSDTALNLGGSSGSYLYANVNISTALSDTFTVEGWVKPDTACSDGSKECFIYNREPTLITRIFNGTMWFGMYDCVSNLQWTNTYVTFESGAWHHFAIVKDGVANTNGSVKLYKDGQLAYTKRGSPYFDSNSDVTFDSSKVVCQRVNGTYDFMYIGIRYGQTYGFSGLIDEIKIWRQFRSSSEIQFDMHNYPTAAQQTSGFLQMYFDFNQNSYEDKVENRVGNLPYTDLIKVGSQTYDDVATYTSAAGNPYNTVKFTRSYLTKNGGWKAPAGISKVSTVIVGGGGGGGGGYEGGGGGAGGFIETLTTLIPGNTYGIKVGAGGRGATNQTPATSSPVPIMIPTNGDTTTAFGMSAIGGGRGSYEIYQTSGAATSGASGGGGSWNAFSGGSGTTDQGFAGGDSANYSGASTAAYSGAGGGGAGGAGQNASATKGGNGGAGKNSVVLNTVLAAGGGGSVRRAIASPFDGTTSNQGLGGSSIGGNSGYLNNAAVGAIGGASSGASNTGSGGGAGYTMDPTTYSGNGGSGGSGVIALRYLNISVPAYTKPTNTTIDVGQYETFTTNIAQDSATAGGMTRTFTWESTTAGTNGPFTLIKSGTGAGNAAFSWLPTDTSTSGSNYLYRLTVTDSDTSGLFITDSSTAFATINKALQVAQTFSGSIIKKTINVSRSETFTITLGTPTYKASYSPLLPGVTLDTSTAGLAILKIADTATIGTFYETLTVTDSATNPATYNVNFTLNIAAPPLLSNSSDVVTTGQVFNLDFSSSASYNPLTGVMKDISGSNRSITAPNGMTYKTDNFGIGSLSSGTTQYLKYTNTVQLKQWTLEAYIRLDESPAAQRYIITSQYTGANINFSLGIDAARTVFVGYHRSAWHLYRTSTTLTVGKWTHVVGIWDGNEMQVYFDGIKQTGGTFDNSSTGADAPTSDGTDVYIDRKWDADASTSMSLGYVRVYNRGLSETETIQNYNATKNRFSTDNLNQLKQSKKYGTLVLESFTATSGSDTNTVTLATGNVAGINWDLLSVPGQLNLTAQQGLSVGTYYDTITVTDNLGQSTYLPISITVTKADTITVAMSSSVTRVYNPAGTGATPTPTINGLASPDFATVTTRYDTVTGTSCATGGACKIGDTGPGGGKVFYISDTLIDYATGVSSGGIYLEVAPQNWNGSVSGETNDNFASLSSDVAGTSSSIGTGAENSRLFDVAYGASATSIRKTLNYTANGFDDWFMPSSGEMSAIYTNLIAKGLGSFSTNRNMATSTQDPSNTANMLQVWSGDGTVGGLTKSWGMSYRPIRAFGGTTTKPSDVATYTVSGHNITFTSGSLSNYYNIVYETSTLKITQANQDKLTLNLYGAVAGSPFLLNIGGGSGTGAVTETVTAGGTAVNCRLNNHVLLNDTPATDQKTCNISITKAASRNYFAETLTATVYFMVFVNDQPSNQVGSGTNIGLNGKTTFTITDTSTGTIPTITALTWVPRHTTFGPMGFDIIPDHWELSGSGFGPANNTNTIVKFWRNQTLEWTTNVNFVVDSTLIWISLPFTNWSPGPIEVTTAWGVAVSDFDFDGTHP